MHARNGRIPLLYNALGLVIPPIVISFMFWAWYLCCFEIGFGYIFRMRGQRLYGAMYIIFSCTLISTLLLMYLEIFTLPKLYGVPPNMNPTSEIPPHYECADMDGNLDFCHKGQCNGRWKPPRTHHCSTCNVCRIGFDHHCPWIGNCVTFRVMKTFLAMLLLTFVTVFILVLPVIPPLAVHILDALHVSRLDAWAVRVWWNNWISWLALGGPPGRWVIGVIIGYRLLDRRPREDCGGRLGCLIQLPYLRVLLSAMMASFLGIFALVVGVWTARHIHRGESSLEALRSLNSIKASSYTSKPARAPLICIISNAGEGAVQATGLPYTRHRIPSQIGVSVQVMSTLQTERPYDLGPWDNWRKLMDASLFGHRRQSLNLCPNTLWPRLNPIMLRRMQTESRHLRSKATSCQS